MTWKLGKCVLFHQDNAPAHKSPDVMASYYCCGFVGVGSLSYSPELNPRPIDLEATHYASEYEILTLCTAQSVLSLCLYGLHLQGCCLGNCLKTISFWGMFLLHWQTDDTMETAYSFRRSGIFVDLITVHDQLLIIYWPNSHYGYQRIVCELDLLRARSSRKSVLKACNW